MTLNNQTFITESFSDVNGCSIEMNANFFCSEIFVKYFKNRSQHFVEIHFHQCVFHFFNHWQDLQRKMYYMSIDKKEIMMEMKITINISPKARNKYGLVILTI